ncbi:MAG TPA: sulfatase-like hydrolase/transferase [Bryobacteraceae bacterium]|nr:sulfatase-like hydrolase/transferase [Bryobacteraceae bacterium]
MSCSQISRRSLLAGAVASTQLRSQFQSAQDAPSQGPNVIVILFDDLGEHDLGYLGATDLKTPNIDQLAANGTVCLNWYSNAPVCAPARSALMTGRFPIRAGVGQNGLPLRPSERTIASILKDHGYATALTGKWHLGSTADTVPNAHGFDYFYGFHEGCVDYFSQRFYWGEPKRVNFHDLWRNRDEIFDDGQYLTERIADEACAFIQKQRGTPFFLYAAFNAVHYPMHAPHKYVERFPNLNPERQMYAAMLSAADDGVGQIIQALEQTGQANNTLIFLLGDNGATRERRAGLNQQPATAGKNTPYRGFKFSAFDGGMHVPALVNWPGHVPKGKFIDQVVMTADILPTVCHLTGAQTPTDRTIDGRNIWPVLKENAHSPHEYICWSEGPQLAIRRGNWKLVLNGVVHDGTPSGEQPLEGDDAVFLSNLQTDPSESTNLRHQHPEITDQLQTLAQQWRKDVQSN